MCDLILILIDPCVGFYGLCLVCWFHLIITPQLNFPEILFKRSSACVLSQMK